MVIRKEFVAVGLAAVILIVLVLVLILATNERRSPPPAITGLIATDTTEVRHGQIDLSWDPSDANDFAYYTLYAAKKEIKDVTGISPIGRINDRADVTFETTMYRIPGLQLALFAFLEDTKYWFAVTAMDLAGNESEVGTSVSAIIEMMPIVNVPTVFITVTYMGFSPQTVTIPKGTTIAWANIDVDLEVMDCFHLARPHTVTSDTGLFNGDLTNWAVVFTHTFTEAGVFGYYDLIKPADPWLPVMDMTATVIVE